ncbi:MAG: AarF/ABC1/UbiB kinase family protein [Chloroflexi bacterium]|nr:AarF/ABC1/UbiB kinase family protein [Chloroflexota bacterium]MBV9597432.1 AarF/ABC1/UbiB kinase family protein [Chloroflexota bacterium]
MRRILRRAQRTWQVVRVITRWFILPALPLRRTRPRPGAERTRAALEQLGGAWIKLGQMLALRFDLLPAAYCEELLKLLNAVQPFPYADVCDIVRQELGGLPDAIFASFEPVPFASASIGQVHRATLRTGERVAVKVQRPQVREVMRADIDLMYAVTPLLDFVRVFGATQTRRFIDEFARWTNDELDYLLEARQALLLYENAHDERLERIPRVHRAYTTSRVLTTELLEGIPLIEIIVAIRLGDSAYLQNLEAKGYDLVQVVRHLDWNMLNQVYVFGCFHSDLHPANLFVLPGNAIGYVDFGMVGRLSETVRESLTRYSWLLFQREVEPAVKELMRWLTPTSGTNTAAAQQQLVRIHEGFLYGIATVAGGDTWASTGALSQNPYTALAVEIMETVQRSRLVLSGEIIAFLRMLVMLGTLRHQLATDYDLPAVARQFFGKLLRRRAEEFLDPRLVMGRVYETTLRVNRAVEFVEYLEEMQPLIASVAGTYFGFQRRLQTLRQRAIGLGGAMLLIGGLLYYTLADPNNARTYTPSVVPFEWVHVILLGLLVLVILMFIHNLQGLVSR